MPKRSTTTRPQPNAEHRRRVYAACSECRRRRRKCNGSQPCAQCEAYGYACTYEAESASQQSDPTNSSSRPAEEPIRQRQSRHVVAPTPTTEDEAASSTLIVSRERGRFINANSAVALPHLIGQQLSIAQPLRLHSYAWNLGLRAERRGTVSSSLSRYLTLPECQTLCAVYFAALHPLFAFLDEGAFSQRLVDSWMTLENQPNFAAVVSLVAVLGSFFSSAPHTREGDMKRHGLEILDLALSAPVAAIDLDAVAGWIVRTLYMRLTTRPAISCMASHIAMQFAEIMGLHRDLGNDEAAAAAAKSSFGQEELESRRRHFCVARFLNVLLTTEYGVSGPAPQHTKCLFPAHVLGAHIEVLHTMTGVLQDAEAAANVGLDSDDYADLFQRLQEIPHGDDDTVALFTADTCLCLLRRFAAASRKPTRQILTIAVVILRRALDGIAALLATDRATWWNMLSVPFQTICVGVSADDLLPLLPAAMERLRALADRFGSHMAKEALATAQQLIAASRASTEAKLALQDAALAHALPAVDIDWAGFDFDMGETTQYGRIGARYNQVNEQFYKLLEVKLLQNVLVPGLAKLPNLKLLEFAGGTGLHTSRILAWSSPATTIASLDISQTMVDLNAANNATAVSWGRLRLLTADGAHPSSYAPDTVTPDLFDAAFGGWFLNCAESRTELRAMFDNVALNIKPGGFFVGVVPYPRKIS